MERLGLRKLHPPTPTRYRASRVRMQSPASQSELLTCSPPIIGTQDGTHLDVARSALASTSLSAVSCSTAIRLRRCRDWQSAEEQRPSALTTDGTWTPTSSIPSWLTDLTARRLSKRDNLHCSRNQPQLDSLCRSAPLTTDRPGRLRSPPTNAVDLTGSHAQLCGLHRRRQHRQHRCRLDHHGDDDRRTLMDGAESTRGHGSLNSVSCPSTADCFAAASTTVLASVERRLRMAPAIHSGPGQWPQLNLLPDHHRLHRGRVRHLRKPRHHQHHQRRGRLDTEASRLTSASSPAVSCSTASTCHAVSDFDTSCSEHHRNHRRRCVVDGKDFPARSPTSTAISCADTLHCTAVGRVLRRSRSGDRSHNERRAEPGLRRPSRPE